MSVIMNQRYGMSIRMHIDIVLSDTVLSVGEIADVRVSM